MAYKPVGAFLTRCVIWGPERKHIARKAQNAGDFLRLQALQAAGIAARLTRHNNHSAMLRLSAFHSTPLMKAAW